MLTPLRRPTFRRLFAARAISLFGSAFAPTALAFAVMAAHGSPAVLGLVVAAGMVSRVALSLVGGVIGDRVPRRTVVMVAEGVAAAAQATAGILLLLHVAAWWELAALNAARGGAGAFSGPALQSLMPQTVERDELQSANVLLGFARNGTMVVGTAVAGIVVAAAGPGWALTGDAATYLGGIVLLAGLPVVAPPGGLARGTILQAAAEGWRIVRSHVWLWSISVQFAFLNALTIGSFLIVGPFVAASSLGGARSWGLILSAQGVGLLLGGLLVSRLRPVAPLRAATWGAACLALPPLALAAHAGLAVVMGAAVVAGVGGELHSVFWYTTLQRRIPGETLARVIAYDELGSFVLIPLGTVGVGLLSETLGRSATLGIGGAVALIATAAVLVAGQVGERQAVDGDPIGDVTAAAAV